MPGSGDSWTQIKAAYATLGSSGRVAAVAGTLCAVILGVSLFNFGSSLLGPGVSSAMEANGPKNLTDAHDAEFARYVAQWYGRSLMIVPGAPAPPAPTQIAEKDPEPTKPSAPTSYDGPAIIAMVLNTVWFSDGKVMSVGDEPKDDIEVVQIMAPWDAIVKWKGVEFTVPLFQRDKLVTKPEEKPAELSPGDAKPDEQTTAATPPESDHPKLDTSKVDPSKLVVSKPSKPIQSPKDAKPDAAPGVAPATAPPPEPGPGEDPNSDSSRPPAGGEGGRS